MLLILLSWIFLPTIDFIYIVIIYCLVVRVIELKEELKKKSTQIVELEETLMQWQKQQQQQQ